MSRPRRPLHRAKPAAPALRVEKDSIGEFPVPAGAYWGINAGRAAANFPVSGQKINPGLISAYCLVKKAAAAVNLKAGLLPAAKARAISRANRTVGCSDVPDSSTARAARSKASAPSWYRPRMR